MRYELNSNPHTERYDNHEIQNGENNLSYSTNNERNSTPYPH